MYFSGYSQGHCNGSILNTKREVESMPMTTCKENKLYTIKKSCSLCIRKVSKSCIEMNRESVKDIYIYIYIYTPSNFIAILILEN